MGCHFFARGGQTSSQRKKFIARQRSCFSSTGFALTAQRSPQKAVLDRRNFGSQKLGLQKSVTKNKERSCCDRSALLKFEVNFEV
jgi:hypothetical protein